MPQISFSRTVSFTPEAMLDLVADVEAYPSFVPHCLDMQVRRDPNDPAHLYDAEMHVQFGPYNGAYTSKVVVDRDACTIRAHAIDGPFSHLESVWHFEQVDEHTQVNFDIDFGFSNPLLAAVAEPAFTRKQSEIMDAFMARAAEKLG